LNVFNSIADFASTRKTVITIGTFDGVHVGHRKIIDRVVQTAFQTDRESVILTFFPHPRMVLHGDSGIKLLNTLDEKEELLRKTGLQNLIVHPFDEAFAQLSAEEFVKSVLVEKLNIGKIIIGYDHRFGRNRDAGIDDLIGFGKQYGFEVEQIPAEEIDAVSVSSTKIRNAINAGEIELANSYLGYAYFFSGKVVKGRQIGREIGFPTANIQIDESYKLVPKIGIYVIKSFIKNVMHYGMMSIGTNPTVGGTALSTEVFYFDFDRDIYGETIRVTVLHYLRDEEKFASLDDLKMQILRDQASALAYIAKR